MRLDWKDGLNTVLAGAVALVALAVTNDWGWPLLGSVRTGSLVVGALGIAMCIGSRGGEAFESGRPGAAVKILAGLGVLALVLTVVGAVGGSESVFMALAIDTIVMWLMATIRHAATGSIPSRTATAS
jgi:hypothetical protein